MIKRPNMNFGAIYIILNRKNWKYYLGSAKNIRKRWARHKNDLRNGSNTIHLQRAWDKDGEENFDFLIIEKIDSNLLDREQYYLDLLTPYDWNIGYNIGKNSCGGDNLTMNPNREDIIKKMSYSSKERYVNMSKERKLELSNNVRGERNSNHGNKWSQKQKDNNSRKLKEYYENHDSCWLGRHHTSYTKQKLSDSAKQRTGSKNPFYGKHHTDEYKAIARERMLGKKPTNTKLIMVNGIQYLGTKDAEKGSGIKACTLWWRANSKNPKFSGIYFI